MQNDDVSPPLKKPKVAVSYIETSIFSDPVELTTENLSRYFQSQMKTPSLYCQTHILGTTDLEFHLTARDDAINSATEQFRTLYEHQISPNQKQLLDRIRLKIPICSGIPGLGKTRIIEEWKSIIKNLKISDTTIGIIVPYYNEQNLHPIENHIPVEASFSWRLLYQFFLEKNTVNDTTFPQWFKHIPKNAAQLDLITALNVIKYNTNRDGRIVIYVGIDEYQNLKQPDEEIECASKERTCQIDTALIQLLNHLRTFIVSPAKDIILLPLFTGTDFSCISVVNSSNYKIIRLPLSLLTYKEVESAVASNDKWKYLLLFSVARRHLFYLGGVPRYFSEYCRELKLERIRKTDNIPITTFDKAYNVVVEHYVQFPGSITGEMILMIVAYSLSGLSVILEQKVFEGFSWARLRDSSLCLLEYIGDSYFVTVPYSVIRYCAKFTIHIFPTLEQRCLIQTLKFLSEKVDLQMFDVPSWMLWERFGAIFHALRINSLMVVGLKTVPFNIICSGALFRDCAQTVLLRPVTVAQSGVAFSEGISEKIHLEGVPEYQLDWIKGNSDGSGHIFLNSFSGEGVDVFFALKHAYLSKYVICVDQRKRVASCIGKKKATQLLKYANIQPNIPNTTLIRGLCSLYPRFNSSKVELPKDTFVVSYSTNISYHGSLATHPAAIPCININYDYKSTIALVLSGKTKECTKGIINRRKTEKFTNMKDLRKFVQSLGGSLKDEDRITF